MLGQIKNYKKNVFVLATIFLFMGLAQARTIEIIQADRLEFRNTDSPEGVKEEYIVITGHPAIVRVDDDEIEANRIEYNKTKRYLQVIGDGVYKSKNETVAGHDFRISVADQGLQGEDVLIVTKELDVQGVSVERLPGQLDVTSGYFSPCSRCDELVNAYAFRAESLTIYPGDRLVGRNVLVLVGDQPIMFLPFIVMPLNDPSRQPRIQIGGFNLNSGTSATNNNDDITALIDWPFTTGGFGMGFILLRHFAARTPAYSFGVDYTFYELLGETSKSRFFFLAEPPKANDNTGAYFAYLFNTSGELDFNPLADPEDRIPPLTFKINLARRDTNILARPGDPTNFGIGTNRRTALDLELGMTDKNYSWQLATNNLFDHGYTLTDTTFANLTRFLPELRINFLNENLPKWGPFSFTKLSTKLGYIIAPINLSNKSVRDEDKQTDNDKLVGAGRFEIDFGILLNYVPWAGATLSGTNNFLGRYYSTKNTTPTEEFERQVQWSSNLAFQQNLFDSRLSFGATYSREMREGETPFAFDILALRPSYRENFGINFSAKPFDWLQLTATELFERSNKTGTFLAKPANFKINLNPAPIVANGTFVYDFLKNEGVSWTVALGNSVTSGLSFSVGTGYHYNVQNNASPFDDLTFSVGYRTADTRFSASIAMVEDIYRGQIRYWTFAIPNLTLGSREDPITFTLSQTLFPPQFTSTPVQPYAHTSGSFGIAYNGWNIGFNNDLNFAPWTQINVNDVPPSNIGVNITHSTDNPTFSFGASTRFNLANFAFYAPQLNGRLDWQIDEETKLGFGFFATLQRLNPSLNTTISLENPKYFVSAASTWSLPDPTSSNFELRNLSLNFGIDLLPGFAVSGNAIAYQRSIVGTNYQDVFTLGQAGAANSGINFVFAAAREGKKKPEFYFTVRFQGSYTFSDNPTKAGQPPTFQPFVGTAYQSLLRPIFIMTWDMCCYVVEFVLDTTPQGGAFGLNLKLGGINTPIYTSDPTHGPRFLPSLPWPGSTP